MQVHCLTLRHNYVHQHVFTIYELPIIGASASIILTNSQWLACLLVYLGECALS